MRNNAVTGAEQQTAEQDQGQHCNAQDRNEIGLSAPESFSRVRVGWNFRHSRTPPLSQQSPGRFSFNPRRSVRVPYTTPHISINGSSDFDIGSPGIALKVADEWDRKVPLRHRIAFAPLACVCVLRGRMK